MAAGATTLTSFLLVLLMFATSSCSFFSSLTSTQPPFGRVLKGVRVSGGYMEVIQEERCSKDTLRLTCRSLRAFVFVLEAEFRRNRTDTCGSKAANLVESDARKSRDSVGFLKDFGRLRGNYVDDNDDLRATVVDLRTSVNKRCSGQKHCRYNVTTDHPGALYWKPATVRLKYACIPEAAVRRYCNEELKVRGGQGGYVNSPGYPLYYLGGNTCRWTFRASPGQRIVITFHDLNIRGPRIDGSCSDVARVREAGVTLFERCGTAAGLKVVSNSNLVTLDLIASKRLYSARGFFLQYQALGCPDVLAPNGSYVSNDTLTSRTFLCRSGSVFLDSKENKRTLACMNGKWNESTVTIPSCVGKRPRNPALRASERPRARLRSKASPTSKPRLEKSFQQETLAPLVSWEGSVSRCEESAPWKRTSSSRDEGRRSRENASLRDGDLFDRANLPRFKSREVAKNEPLSEVAPRSCGNRSRGWNRSEACRAHSPYCGKDRRPGTRDGGVQQLTALTGRRID
ncbi:hypothetical protein KM043_009238 [Ampulex compressa]|nr:hypothetical protein KM043_009238 [Ampulex compressa]